MAFDINKMLLADVYDHPATSIRLLETHISWIVLTGDYAYKIKKPVNFGFLDFSSLQQRRHFCEQEIVLNRRLSSNIYLTAVAISEQQDKLILDESNIVEYAVKMRQFAQTALFDNMLAAGQLTGSHMDALARRVALFHQQAQRADDSMPYGQAEDVHQPVMENFRQIHQQLTGQHYDERLSWLEKWCQTAFGQLKTVLDQRKRDGFVRECHGDMHLANLIWLQDPEQENSAGVPMAFDCIEFNQQLRWIDVMSEIAFLVMDLQHRNQAILAQRFLNTYLEVSGDYAGLSVLTYYLSYRALVRAKVNALRLGQQGINRQQRQHTMVEFESYLDLAKTYTRRSALQLIIMRGVSASGKSTVSQQLVDHMGAIRVRSDIERKRLFRLDPDEHAQSAVGDGLYTEKGSERTYQKLQQLAAQIFAAGYSVIVDAAFLQQQQRLPFVRLAQKLGLAYVILQTSAPAEVLRQRIVSREHGPSDANLDVLEYQLARWQELDTDELAHAITLDTTQLVDLPVLIRQIQHQ
jgi:aminoglycoside phosphotransferase family enzyme/predicted kinase